MANDICGTIPPRRHEIIGERDDYLAECVLPDSHTGPHVIRTPEGKLIAWEDCCNECGDCESPEEDPCYSFWEIKELPST
jgi:hypothetical protein